MTKTEFFRLWKGLLEHFDASVIKKTNSTSMVAIADLLDLLKIQEHDEFLESWAITINNRIYVPFTPGTSDWSYEGQLACLCHELVHVLQWRDPLFLARYISSTAHRAELETNALITELEAWQSLVGELPPLDEKASSLLSYGCKKADVKVVEKALTMASIRIEKGAVGTPVGKVLRKLMLIPHLA